MNEDEHFEEEEQGGPAFVPDIDIDDILRKARSFETSGVDSEPPPEIENRQPRELNEKEVQVVGVYEHQPEGAAAPSAFVLLKDSWNRMVPIFIGRFEAVAISVALEGATYPRPMTHDLLKNVVDRLGGRVERITIDDLWQQTYYAKISILMGAETVDIDARPSDAIALAVRSKSPIFMAEAVLAQSSIDEET